MARSASWGSDWWLSGCAAGHPARRRPGQGLAGTWPPVKVVRPVGRSTLTGGQNPAPLACGSKADGMAPRLPCSGEPGRTVKAALTPNSPSRNLPTQGSASRQDRYQHGHGHQHRRGCQQESPKLPHVSDHYRVPGSVIVPALAPWYRHCLGSCSVLVEMAESEAALGGSRAPPSYNDSTRDRTTFRRRPTTSPVDEPGRDLWITHT